MLTISSKFILITDLDGSLLDHDSYVWHPAQAWLDYLQGNQIPIIFCTSKTSTEVKSLQERMHLQHWPFICENGAIVYIDHSAHIISSHANTAQTYPQICAHIHHIKQHTPYRCTGFSDMSVQDVVTHTGLSLLAAEQAKSREGSEALLWQDSETHRLQFAEKLQAVGLTMIQGGRFWHVINQGADKANALDYLLQQQYSHTTPPITIGLGDGPNDIQLLEKTDFSVVIKNHYGQHIQLQKNKAQVKYTQAKGPNGWAEGLTHFIQR